MQQLFSGKCGLKTRMEMIMIGREKAGGDSKGELLRRTKKIIFNVLTIQRNLISQSIRIFDLFLQR
jgi:hypothetical protein